MIVCILYNEIKLQHRKESKKLYCLYQELAGYRQDSASSIIPESPGKVPDGKAEEKKADYTETQTTNIYTTLVKIAGQNSNKLYTYKKINLIYIFILRQFISTIQNLFQRPLLFTQHPLQKQQLPLQQLLQQQLLQLLLLPQQQQQQLLLQQQRLLR